MEKVKKLEWSSETLRVAQESSVDIRTMLSVAIAENENVEREDNNTFKNKLALKSLYRTPKDP